MLPTLRHLFQHCAWADGEQLRAISAQSAARDDPAIRRRLRHMHHALSNYLAFWKGLGEIEDCPETSFEELRDRTRQCHSAIAAFLEGLTGEALSANLPVPEAPGQPLTLAEAMLQAVLHSHYHRGQNAARLRELGAEPPVTELTAWVLTGKPAPRG